MLLKSSRVKTGRTQLLGVDSEQDISIVGYLRSEILWGFQIVSNDTSYF